MKQTIIVGTLALALVLPGVASANGTRAKLEKWDILTTSVTTSSGAKAGRGMGLLHGPPELIFAVLKDFSTYKEYMPRITGSYRSAKDHYVVKCKLPWPLKNTWANVKVVSGKRGKTFVVTWKMTRGTLKQFEGTAWIKPYGKGSLMTYQMVLSPNAPIPDSLLASSMKSAAWEVIHGVRKRSEAIQAGKIPLSSYKVARK